MSLSCRPLGKFVTHIMAMINEGLSKLDLGLNFGSGWGLKSTSVEAFNIWGVTNILNILRHGPPTTTFFCCNLTAPQQRFFAVTWLPDVQFLILEALHIPSLHCASVSKMACKENRKHYKTEKNFKLQETLKMCNFPSLKCLEICTISSACPLGEGGHKNKGV